MSCFTMSARARTRESLGRTEVGMGVITSPTLGMRVRLVVVGIGRFPALVTVVSHEGTG